VVSEKLAKSAELSLTGILLAKLECLHSGALIHDLESGIVSKNIENGTVGLPQKLEPWGDDCTIGTILGLLARDGGKKDRFWGLRCFEIINAGSSGGCLDAGLNGVCLGLGIGDLGLS